MKLEISCAMCGKDRDIVLKCDDVDPGKSLRRIIEDEGWVVQQNGPNFDIYCSKRCAQ